MSPPVGNGGRPRVAIVADAPTTTMLAEWLQAAGFASAALADGGTFAAVLWRWNVPLDAAAVRAPVVVLHDVGNEVRTDVCLPSAEFVPWPDSTDMRSLLEWSSQLFTLLRRVCSGPVRPASGSVIAPVVPTVLPPAGGPRRDPALVAVGVSTGGPSALRELLAPLPAAVLPPIVIVQHIPSSYVAELAGRLQRQTGYPCELAREGLVLQRGVAYFAFGEHHLRVTGGATALQCCAGDEPPRRGHRPAADVLFESCARLQVTGVGVIMTGMGQDGAAGLLLLRQRGWATLGQAEASCAIYGMPRAAKQLGAVERELPLAELGAGIVAACKVAVATPARR